jgi:MFS transporter, ACDE family, multidrug resistance protein
VQVSDATTPGPDTTTVPSRRPPFPLLAAVTITGILANTLVSAPLPDILEDFGKSDGAAGLVIAAASLPGILVAPLIGLMADRYGRRTILVPCLVVFGIGGTLAGLAPVFWMLLLARFVQGLGSAGLINLTNILIGDHWDGVERSRMYGYNSAVLTVSLAVFPGIGGLLTEVGGWRWAFLPYPLAFVTAFAVYRTLDPGVVNRSRTPRDQLREALAVVGRPRVLAPVGLSFLAFVFIFGLMLTVLPVHLEDEFGLGASARGLVIAAPALGATAGALFLGRMRRHMSAVAVAALSFGLFAVAYPIVGLAGSISIVVAATVLVGLGEGLMMPTLTDLVAGSAPERDRGAVLSVQVSAIRAGQSTGPLMGGVGMNSLATGTVFVIGGVVAAATTCGTALAGRQRQQRR